MFGVDIALDGGHAMSRRRVWENGLAVIHLGYKRRRKDGMGEGERGKFKVGFWVDC